MHITGDFMNSSQSAAILAAFVAVASCAAQAQDARTTQTPYRELDPARRVTPPPAVQPAPVAPAPVQAPVQAEAAQEPAPAATSAAYEAPVASHSGEAGRGGFFIGAHAGKGWVYEDVDQNAAMLNAGYRWQVGSVSLIGVEVAAGKLDDATDDGWRYDAVDFASIGANARFNFGAGNPVYAVVRTGYWAADTSVNDGDEHADIDGGYFGLGLGVDFNRHVNMSLVYTNYVYFEDYGWTDDDDFYYDVNRADTLMLGVEVRF